MCIIIVIIIIVIRLIVIIVIVIVSITNVIIIMMMLLVVVVAVVVVACVYLSMRAPCANRDLREVFGQAVRPWVGLSFVLHGPLPTLRLQKDR